MFDVIEVEIEIVATPFRQRYFEAEAAAELTRTLRSRPAVSNLKIHCIKEDLVGLRCKTFDLFARDLLQISKSDDKKKNNERNGCQNVKYRDLLKVDQRKDDDRYEHQPEQSDRPAAVPFS